MDHEPVMNAFMLRMFEITLEQLLSISLSNKQIALIFLKQLFLACFFSIHAV